MILYGGVRWTEQESQHGRSEVSAVISEKEYSVQKTATGGSASDLKGKDPEWAEENQDLFVDYCNYVTNNI